MTDNVDLIFFYIIESSIRVRLSTVGTGTTSYQILVSRTSNDNEIMPSYNRPPWPMYIVSADTNK